MAYQGKIYYDDVHITVQDAVDLNLVYADSNDDIWLKQDTLKVVKITGDLHLTS